MTINRNLFFEDFTLNICSSLNIEAAMRNTLKALPDEFPADEMHLYTFDYDNRIFKIIAKATKESDVLLNQVHPLTKKGLQAIWEMDQIRSQILYHVEDDPILKTLFTEEEAAKMSGLLIPLKMEEHVLGAAALYYRGECPYTEEHVDLMSAVRQPLCIAAANAEEHMGLLRRTNRLDEENTSLRQQIHSFSDNEIIGIRGGLRESFDMIQTVAPMNCPVLILGETGTGKEVAANTIYKYSTRSDGPYVKVNCGAIPDSLIDSELFGHEKGSFTGAVVQKKGWFERADHGTIFLDEIGELPLEAQVRLLRVIQDHEIKRVGGHESIPLDIRIICATNQDLGEMVRKGTFREDLFFRINVFPIYMPPLRQRREDIPLLIHRFIDQKAMEMGLKHVPSVTDEDLRLLQKYDWPGNVRELQNILERAIILRKGNYLDFRNILPEIYRQEGLRKQGGYHVSDSFGEEPLSTLEESMAKVISDALQQTGGRISGPRGAAALLDINPSTLRSRIKKLGIENPYQKK